MKKELENNRYVTPVNMTFVIINVVVYLILEILGDTTDGAFMYAHGAMYPWAVLEEGEWYRMLTAAFIHFGLPHLVNNMVLMICLGSYLERAYGRVKYAILFLICGIGGNLISMFAMIIKQNMAIAGGASGVVFGLIGALLFLVLKNKGRFEDLTLKRFLLMMALALYYGFSTAGVDNAAHVGGLMVGFVMGCIYFVLEWVENRMRMHRS